MSLLVITLVVTGVLTFLGQRAAKDHKQAVEKSLLNNAAYAAERYVEAGTNTIVSVFRLMFPEGSMPVEPKLGNVTFPELDRSAKPPTSCSCNPLTRVKARFAYDYQSDSLVLSEGKLPPKDRARLIDFLKTNPVEWFRASWAVSFRVDGRTPGAEAVGFLLHREGNPADDPNLAPRLFAIGFLADPGIALDALPTLAQLDSYMPNFDPEAKHNRFALSVYSDDPPIRDQGTKSDYKAEKSFGPGYAGMKAVIYIDPSAVPIMAGVAVPATRYATLFGLMALASILIGASLILARRQSELAAAREDFASSVSHELRTPLAQIRMFTETLLLGRVRNEVERRRSLEIIDQEAKRLTALVENVLHLTRAERGTARLTPAATQLAPAVRDVVDTFAQLPRSRSVDFRVELEDRLVALVDPGALRQILLNLLDNAIKYGPAGQRVNVGLAMFEEHARLWVDDQGPGIPTRERDRVFEPFYRSSTHRDSSVAGSGIGLAVVRELAGLLNGRAWIDDAPGGGARVVIEFPDAYLRAEEATGSWAVA